MGYVNVTWEKRMTPGLNIVCQLHTPMDTLDDFQAQVQLGQQQVHTDNIADSMISAHKLIIAIYNLDIVYPISFS